MASRRFNQFTLSLNPYLVMIQGTVAIGATGAVGTTTGSGISSVVRLAAGTYKIILEDNYYRYLNQECRMRSASTGSTAVGSITPGTVVQIATMGTTTQAQWETAGVPAGVTAAVGLVFLVAATSTGTGTVSVSADSAITAIEAIGNPQTSINQTAQPYIVIQTLQGVTGASASDPVLLVPADPVSGSTLEIQLWLRNSSLPGKGE